MTGFSSTASMWPASEVQRGQDLVAAGGADDEHPLRWCAGRREGEQARVAVEAAEGLHVTVEAVDARAVESVVVQHAEVRAHLGHVDAEDRAPRRVHGVVVAEIDLGRVLALAREQRGRDNAGEQHRREHGRDRGHDPRVVPQSDANGDERHDQPGQQDGRGWSDPAEQRDDDRARQPRAEEVGEVQPPDRLGPAPEQRRHDDADGDERGEQREADDDETRDVGERGARCRTPRSRTCRSS